MLSCQILLEFHTFVFQLFHEKKTIHFHLRQPQIHVAVGLLRSQGILGAMVGRCLGRRLWAPAMARFLCKGHRAVTKFIAILAHHSPFQKIMLATIEFASSPQQFFWPYMGFFAILADIATLHRNVKGFCASDRGLRSTLRRCHTTSTLSQKSLVALTGKEIRLHDHR